MDFDDIALRMMKLGVDRVWLAEQTSYTPDTIRQMLAPNGNPKAKTERALKTIKEALDREEAKQQSPVTQLELHQIVLRPTDDEFNNWNREANKENVLVKDWCIQALNDAASKILAGKWDNVLRPKEAIYKTNTNRSAHLHAAAGSPILSEVQDWDGADDAVLVKINGLSMSPMFADGEIIAMKHKRASSTPYAAKGKIYLFAYEGGYTVKKYNTRKATKEEVETGISYLSPTDNKHKVRVLQSINPDFPEIVLKEEAEWFAWMPK